MVVAMTLLSSSWRLFVSTLVCLLVFSPLTACQQTFFPSAIPLSVRSPYLSVWENAGNQSVIPEAWAQGWSLDSLYGWQGYAKIDGVTYTWRGDWVSNATTLSQIIITPTRTIYTLQAGPMTLNVTYLSPIEPGDFVRQSIPFSYVYVEAKSNDGKSHALNVYADVSAEWVSGNRNAGVSWNTTRVANTIYHNIAQTSTTLFTEASDQAEWGTFYHATSTNYGTVADMTGSDQACRGWFQINGTLPATHDPQYRAINLNFPVFALNVDLGSISQTQQPVVFTVGLTRDPAIQYLDLAGNVQNRSLYFESRYSDMGQMIDDFLTDFPSAKQRAEQLDERILGQAVQGFGTEYADLVSLAARQVYGATELTIAKGTDGQWNQSDVMMFMKSIGDANSTRRVNAVETLYAAFPMFMYIDPTLGAPLLEPLLRFQGSPSYQNPYAAQDIGSRYPIAQGSNVAHTQRIEQTSNMIIMTYAYMRASNATNFALTYYSLLYEWAVYLNATVETDGATELTADQESGNGPNLQLKGVVALMAMSFLAGAVGNEDHASQLSSCAQKYALNWRNNALDPLHQQMLAAFGQYGSWSLGYNLFADAWLHTGIAHSFIMETQSALYESLLSSQQNTFGMPIDSDSPLNGATSSSWSMFAAAISHDTTQKEIISRVHAHASFNQSNHVFPTLYDPRTGVTSSGQASAAQGAMFAPLALLYSTAASHSNIGPSSRAGLSVSARVGISVGAVAFLALIGLGIWWFLRRHKRRRPRSRHFSLEPDDFAQDLAVASEITPFSPYEMVQHPDSQNSTSFVMVGNSSYSDSSAHQQQYSAIPLDLAEAPTASGKRAEAMQAMQAKRAVEATLKEGPLSPGMSSSSHTGGGSEADGLPHNDAAWALAGEVEHLRREMEILKAERAAAQLPPPSYDDIRRAANTAG